MKSYILFASKDPGGTNNIVSVKRTLCSMSELSVKTVAQGIAVEILRDLGEDFIECGCAQRFIEEHGFPAVLITSMCTDQSIGRDLVPLLLREHVPVIALQDSYGGALKTSWEEKCYRPDRICVNDDFGVGVVRDAWPDFLSSNICITGYPALDVFADYNVVQKSIETRELLDISQGERVVLYCGSVSDKRTRGLVSEEEVLHEIISALDSLELGREICFIARQHPRMVQESPEELSGWQRAVNLTHGRVIDSSGVRDTRAVIAASTVVLSMGPSIPVEASMLRKQHIAILYPKMLERFLLDFGGAMPKYPFTTLGCSAEVRNQSELRQILQTSLTGDLGLTEAQKQHFNADGRNTERVVEVVLSFIDIPTQA